MRPDGTQRFRLAALALAALGCIAFLVIIPPDFRAVSPDAKGIGGPFALTAGDGKTVSDRTFRGRWMLVYFGYTHCPNICPATLLALSQALDQLGPLAAKTQPLFVTIDPERDTPPVIAEFTRAFDPRIVGLTGKPADIATVAKEYRVFYKKVPGEAPDEYWMEHSSYIYVIDPEGRYVTLLPSEEAQNPDDLASSLRQVLSPSPPGNPGKTSAAAQMRSAARSE